MLKCYIIIVFIPPAHYHSKSLNRPIIRVLQRCPFGDHLHISFYLVLRWKVVSLLEIQKRVNLKGKIFSKMPSFINCIGVNLMSVSAYFSCACRWLRPSQINGVLEFYSIFLSQDGAEPLLAYNSTAIVEDHTLRNLTPGTFYAITVAVSQLDPQNVAFMFLQCYTKVCFCAWKACTGGGCTLSPPSHAQTEESSPENVPAPLVTPLSPHALNVSWSPPHTPNGNSQQLNRHATLTTNRGFMFKVAFQLIRNIKHLPIPMSFFLELFYIFCISWIHLNAFCNKDIIFLSNVCINKDNRKLVLSVSKEMSGSLKEAKPKKKNSNKGSKRFWY